MHEKAEGKPKDTEGGEAAVPAASYCQYAQKFDNTPETKFPLKNLYCFCSYIWLIKQQLLNYKIELNIILSFII
jgi:hypothetical protein